MASQQAGLPTWATGQRHSECGQRPRCPRRSPLLGFVVACLAACAQADDGACIAQAEDASAQGAACLDLAAATEANLRKTVSLSFGAIKIRALLNLLSDASDVYMYATESVNGTISITTSNAPVRKVLADLTQSRHWVYKTVKDSVLVGPPAEVDEAIEKKLFWTIPR